MITEKNIKIILQIILFSTLGIYILIGELPNIIFDLKNKDSSLIWIFKILGIILSSFMILSSFKWGFFLKFWLGKSYIAGHYQGFSEKKDGNIVEKKHFEKIEIVQTLISTKIIGISYDENYEFYSTWTGNLIEINEKTFKFIVIMDTPTKQLDAILTLNIDDLSMKGFGITLEIGLKRKWKFYLTKK